MADEIFINVQEAKAVYFSQSGREREIMNRDGIFLVTDAFDDEKAIRFLAKQVELQILGGEASELLDLYKNGRLTLVVAFLSRQIHRPTALPVVQTIQKIGRYDVNVFRNANLETLDGILKKTIATQPLVVDEAVVKQADLKASKPQEPAATYLDRRTWTQMTKSLEKTPVRKRRNWSFVLDDAKYGKSIIRFENGKFLDYTDKGVQRVSLFDPDEWCGQHNKTTDVTSAFGASTCLK